jgi:anhydro-N-acetylmuramic acid kinase
MSALRTLGLMSGTSLDGIDAALVRFEGGPDTLQWALEAFQSTPYAAERRERIHSAIVHGSAAALCRLHADLGEWFAEAAVTLCSRHGVSARDIVAIGSHGQTVWHEPPVPGRRGATLQLGCPATIAERTGIAVVSDFRTRDMAAGGQGAPLVPFADRMLYAAADRTRVLVNIGGMANLTRVPPRGSRQALLAFDTGPGNALIDAAVSLATAGRETFDSGGERAASGGVDEELLAGLMADPFFAQPPPKSTGRERFGRPFVEQLIAPSPPQREPEWANLIATLTAFTARTIADAIRTWVLPRGADEIIITGGGASNRTMMGALAQMLAPLPVRDGRAAGIDPDAKEAIAFAALAWAHLAGVPGNFPEVTGASGSRVLGSYTPGRP